jgi:hypothetical protein
MEQSILRPSEIVGLGIALVAHVLLIMVMWFQPARDAMIVPERMTVSIAEDVGLTSMSLDPAEDSQAAMAPVFGDEPAPAPAVDPQPTETVRSDPQPRPTTRPQNNRPVVQQQQRTQAPTNPSSSRLGNDFLEGAAAGNATENRIPASEIGSSERASIVQDISRQLKPHWSAPQGVDADALVTILAWDLNEDGSLKGRPRVVNQTGINDSNRAQAARHAEQAIRAVQLAAPFDLPLEYYNGWKRITGARFDRNLSR